MRCPYQYHYYVVKQGDTLKKIAKQQYLNIGDIVKLNKPSDLKKLKAGIAIKLPSDSFCCKNGRFYKISPCDTLSLIAKTHRISPKHILDANPYFNPNHYLIGQIIILPYQTDKHSAHDISAKPSNRYTLLAGEDLIRVCRKFKIKPTQLLDLNPEIKPLDFTPGTSIIVPKQK